MPAPRLPLPAVHRALPCRAPAPVARQRTDPAFPERCRVGFDSATVDSVQDSPRRPPEVLQPPSGVMSSLLPRRLDAIGNGCCCAQITIRGLIAPPQPVYRATRAHRTPLIDRHFARSSFWDGTRGATHLKTSAVGRARIFVQDARGRPPKLSDIHSPFLARRMIYEKLIKTLAPKNDTLGAVAAGEP